MRENYIQLKDVDLEKLKVTIIELLASMEISKCSIYQHKKNNEFVLTFPDGISNEMFIFFYCALMAPDLTNSKELLGWFWANDDMTIYKQSGDFSSFEKTTCLKKIMITPDGDDKENIHQYGVTENGKEIHFGMDGTFKCKLPQIRTVQFSKITSNLLFSISLGLAPEKLSFAYSIGGIFPRASCGLSLL